MSEPSFEYDFFVSRRGSIDGVAAEVVGILEAEGFKVVEQSHDFPLGGRFPADIHNALMDARHFLILHSADYTGSPWTQAEYASALSLSNASEGQRRIGLLRCDAAIPDGLFHSLTRGDLHGVTDPVERRRIVLAVANGQTPRQRPASRIFGGPMPAENPLFTGRDDLLTELHAALSRGDGIAALTQAAVHGLGGIGKTSLARAYVARHGHEYPGVWWIAAADRIGARDGLADLARVLLPGLPADATPDDAARAALKQLSALRTPFLLIYDNAPAPMALAGLLPTRGARVLITSRHPDWAEQAAALPVGPLPPDEAAELLQARAGRPEPDGATRLARELGYLPLALTQAGAYVKSHPLTGFAAYADRVEALIGQASRNPNPDYPASVGATFDIAIGEAGPAAEAVLGLFAWLAPERIPLSLLDDSIGKAAEREDGLVALISVSLVTVETDAADVPVASVHRLVQATMRNRLAARGEADAARDRAVGRLVSAFPDAYNNPVHWPLCRLLLPHQRAVAARIEAGLETADLAVLLGRAGSFHLGSGDAAGALPLHRRALAVAERVLGPEHPDTLTDMSNLAVCMETQGDAAGALPLLRRALAVAERVLGPEHPDTLRSINNLAACMQTLGDAAGALSLYRRALEVRERVRGPEHPDTMVSVNNLAACMATLGDVAGALPMHRRTLQARERVLGPEHPDTLASMNNLALCMLALGDAAGSLPLHRRALEVRERVLGLEHPNTLGSVNNLALCMEALGDAAEALPLFRRALAVAERVLGPEHPTTRIFRANVARASRALDP
jgi:tetratricopeptide (TPR) repeat protein